jgi:hypothetical protein
MKMIIFTLLVFLALCTYAQEPPKEYTNLISKADSLYRLKLYKDAAYTYTEAFRANHWKGFIPDFYGAAKAWAMINNLDSAFRKLDRIISFTRHEVQQSFDPSA